ncbi:type I polyketide synthase [Streptomyces sp. NBC_00378]|uniref:type I polyketide synthase n=1 Tax=Streptomyces sp. NBC_00378 TaxID=2975732 RepID=UPI00224DD558|nr:type I polyketide synthase [Streptomyces sp. NBC_00378]MCX5114680.1 type I polyketide synthase [Streptomyces sp. NBC_00378]
MAHRTHPRHQVNPPIAVIGMGCRLPGDADSPAALWRLLVKGREAVSTPPPGREMTNPEDGLPSHAQPVFHRGGYLKDISRFDADFFGVSGREADVLDPQHRLLLEVAWEALEHAGLPPERLAGSPTGVFTGLSYNDYMDQLAGQPQELEGSILTNGHCVAAGRLSYLLGLHGPSLAVDTACSSSLVAFHLACESLHRNDCDLALAAGVTLMLAPRITRSFARMGMLSPTGHCHTFDAAADGFVRGEGCGAVVLKRLADARKDGDRILAVVRGSAVNQDGRSDGLAAPSLTAQQTLYRTALDRAGVDPARISLVEAHGTGTPVGDPVEFASLAAVYGNGLSPCALGSVKTILGHLEPAAGITGLIKTVLCLQHGTIPPNLHFTRWNPAIAADTTRFFVPVDCTPWPGNQPVRLAAVSSFGFSGTNAHVILQQPPTPRRPSLPAPRKPRPSPAEVILVAAGSHQALPDAARRLADWLDNDGANTPLRDTAHTLALRRSPGRGRLAVLARSRTETVDALRLFADGLPHPALIPGTTDVTAPRQPVWVFSGQGSQWPGMGRELLAHDKAFAKALNEVDALIRNEAGFSVLGLIRAGEPITGCPKVQPVLFALQIALAATWQAHGVRPAAVIGHSMGEAAAAVVAGALTLADGVRVICHRSALLERIAGTGAMASVGLAQTTVEATLADAGADAVSVAVLAAPDTTIISGDADQITHLTSQWDQLGIPAALIAVDVASHSPHVDSLLPDLHQALSSLTPRPPRIPFYSTVTEDPRHTSLLDAAYWCDNLRRPVRFHPAVVAAAQDRHQIYIEISPHPVVTQSLTDSLTELVPDAVVLPTLRRAQDEPTTFRAQLATLHCNGGTVDWTHLYGEDNLVDAPTITFDRTHHWAVGRTTPAHVDALPGRHTETPGDQVRHTWSAAAPALHLPWLNDHHVHGTPILPGAGFCALLHTTAHAALTSVPTDIGLTDITFQDLLRLDDDTQMSTTVTLTNGEQAACEVHSRNPDGSWQLHAAAIARRGPAPHDARPTSVPSLSDRHPVPLDPARLYAALRACGLEHGPAFTGITTLHTTSHRDSFWADIQLPPTARTPEPALSIHPVLLDLCLQLLVAGIGFESTPAPILPLQVRALRILGDPTQAAHAHARVTENNGTTLAGDVRVLNAQGQPLLALDGVRFTRREPTQDNAVDQWFMQHGWHRTPSPRTTTTPPGNWLIMDEGDGQGEHLATLLRAAGAQTEVREYPSDAEELAPLADTFGQHLTTPTNPWRAVVLLFRAPTAPHTDPVQGAQQRARRLLAFAQAADEHRGAWRLYAVTRHAYAVTEDESGHPAHSTVRGVARVMAVEQPHMRPTLIDTDPGENGLRALAVELLADAPEDEVALRGDTRHIARINRAPITPTERTACATRTVRFGQDGFRLRVGQLGNLDSLELAATGRRQPGEGEVEVRVDATGLNFRDVLTTLGMLGSKPDTPYRIGFECAGEISAVGPGVHHLRPKDNVLAVQLEGGAFGSFITLPAAAVTPLPPTLSPTTAAGLPTAYLTAWYALRHVAQLAPGERVLIHSATGGTGLAAIAVARLLGADILATAGSEEKRHHLRGMGIRCVMDSRTLDFAEQTRQATDGQGVDVVLNSLSGPAVRAGLESLRPFGRFIELGVRDILADAPLRLAPLRHNITFSTVDLIELQQRRPELFATVFREAMGQIAAQRLKPLLCTEYPLDRAADAFHLMARAGHIGKIVLTVPDRGETTAVLPDGPPVVRTDGAYIITGGLGGLGLATARWLAEQGASRIILNGRRCPSLETARDINELASSTTVVLGDISRPDTAQRLVTAATTGGVPLRGIVHCAMVLDDAALATVRDHQLKRVWAPKVTGAWNLHQATATHSLDWFVLYSSMSSLLGNAGQGTYAAANAWLDAFATWRTRNGSPTLAVDWGPWGETGQAVDFAERGYETIPTRKGLEALHSLLAHQRVQTAVIPGPAQTWIPSAAAYSSLFELLAPAPSESAEPVTDGDNTLKRPQGGIRCRLEALPAGIARQTALESYLADHIRAILRTGSSTLDPHTPLKSLGFDSLLATELRIRLDTDLDVRLASNFVWQHPTVASLATALAIHMGLAPRDEPPHSGSSS